jgi:hypothetical protein
MDGFRMKAQRIAQRRLRKLKRRIRRRQQRARYQVHEDSPVIRGGNIRFEMADKVRGISCGGIGAMHRLVERLGLQSAIDSRLKLLQVHRPYSESDHVLNMTYNLLCGGQRLEDIELRRNDEVFLDAIGADALPDPTTAGDFCRRFGEPHIRLLMEAFDEARLQVWQQQSAEFFERADIQMDGSIVETTGECKEGMSLSYKGIWGYHPLVVSLANTQEVLRVRNRPGNRPSHEDAWYDVDESLLLCRKAGFREIRLTGDTDFSQTAHLDRWDASGDVTFVFGMGCSPTLHVLGDEIPAEAFRKLERRAKYQIKTSPRTKPKNVKEQVVIENEYRNIRLQAEYIAEIDYQPTKCHKSYRLIVLRKDLSIEQGQRKLFDDYRYFFYLTNDRDSTVEEIVFTANARCDQENLIAQLKSQRALHAPLNTLNANWAWMVIASLAWNLTRWWGWLLPEGKGRWRERHNTENHRVRRMEFRTFLQSFIQIPAQIVKTSRRIVYRLLSFNEWEPVLFRWLHSAPD